jgi:hypothetical protein
MNVGLELNQGWILYKLRKTPNFPEGCTTYRMPSSYKDEGGVHLYEGAKSTSKKVIAH